MGWRLAKRIVQASTATSKSRTCGNCPLILSLHASHRRPMASLGCVTLHGYSLWLQLWRLFWVCSTCLVQINRVYERFLRYFCRPLLSGTCPVRLILFCFPSACALGSIESLHFTPSKQFSLQFASKASLDMPGINICRCQCRKQLGLRSGHSLLNFQRTYQRDWVEKTSTFSSCDETVLWCRALFSNTLRLHQPL